MVYCQVSHCSIRGILVSKCLKFVQADKLRQEVLLAVGAKEERSPKHRDAELKAAAESIQYEDWAVDYNLVCFFLFSPITRGTWMSDVHV
jgi:hypothetical protein